MKASASASREGGDWREVATLFGLRAGMLPMLSAFAPSRTVDGLQALRGNDIFTRIYRFDRAESPSMAMERAGEPFAAVLSPAAATRRESLISGSLLGRRLELAAVSPGESLPKRRLRIYELNPNLHCSIVGTCLSTGDLRQLLGKLNIAAIPALSEHDLHKHGVTLASQKDAAGKLLHKALDRRHKTALNQFAKAKCAADIASLWGEAVQRGEIPGAYWAVLTHPLTGPALVKRAFGEVHMLSHLVGAAGRADIRRLRQIEGENASLERRLSSERRSSAAASRSSMRWALRAANGASAPGGQAVQSAEVGPA